MQRSLLDQNEPLLHAESFLSDQQCRSLLASAIRPVRHNAPLQLSCRCKAQEPSLIDSWRADSESLSMAPARNYPMFQKSQKTQRPISRQGTKRATIADQYSLEPSTRSPVSSARGDLSLHIIIQSP